MLRQREDPSKKFKNRFKISLPIPSRKIIRPTRTHRESASDGKPPTGQAPKFSHRQEFQNPPDGIRAAALPANASVRILQRRAQGPKSQREFRQSSRPGKKSDRPFCKRRAGLRKNRIGRALGFPNDNSRTMRAARRPWANPSASVAKIPKLHPTGTRNLHARDLQTPLRRPSASRRFFPKDSCESARCQHASPRAVGFHARRFPKPRASAEKPPRQRSPHIPFAESRRRKVGIRQRRKSFVSAARQDPHSLPKNRGSTKGTDASRITTSPGRLQ